MNPVSINKKSNITTANIPIWTKKFILICLSNLAVFLSLQILLPTMPLYIISLGGNQGMVGFIMGIFTLSVMVARSISGWLVDNFGRKKIMIIGLSLCLVFTPMYFLSTDLTILTITRIFHGLALGIAGTAIGTLAADSLPSSRLAEGIGYFGLTTTLSMSVAPMIGLWLVENFNYFILFASVVTFSMLAFVLSLSIEKDKNIYQSKHISSISEVLSNILEKTSLIPAFVILFTSVIYGAILFYISLYQTSLGIENTGIFFAVISAAMLISRPISGQLSDNGKTNLVMIISFISIAISIVIIGLSNGLTGLLIAAALNGIGFGSCLPALQAMAIKYAPPHRRGAATATFFMFFELGLGLGGMLLGYVAQAVGYKGMFLSTLITHAIAMVIYFMTILKKTKEIQNV